MSTESETGGPVELPASEPAEQLPGGTLTQTIITIAMFVGFVLFVAICLPLYFF
ncbi:hypothetical protein LKO27_11760 [Tessaracoccus sp. OS52]|uniref:hypothetical protein n=1 Tax=Tessaracoccus sp. OS52 TaxID=2886691 RepID=UPI001D110B4C|nr:hypothetical protein [Tessaracoccus sp. OS52]MCC2594082.1 hypothetical protein [Tessaracoccus sp. OS52]